MTSEPKPPRPWALVLLFVVIALALAAGAWTFHARERERAVRDSEDDLRVIARLKSDEIVRWLEGLHAEAENAGQTRSIRDDARRFFAGGDPEAEEAIRAWIARRVRTARFAQVWLFDPEGRPRLSHVDGPPPDARTRKLVARALEDRAVVFDDLRREGEDLHLDFVVPLAGGAAGAPPAGAVVLRTDPRAFLFPLLQAWPTGSPTAETLLVRRDGDDVLYLNDLRHRADTALRLRHPLADGRLPAARAVRGQRGLFAGVDYRGVPVIAALDPLPGTDWALISKIDLDELTAPVRERGLIAGSQVLAILVATGAWLAFLWRRHSLSFYRRLYRAEQEKQVLAQHYADLARFANDAHLLVDADGDIVEVNDRATSFFGYERTELLGRPIASLRTPGARDAAAARLGGLDAFEGVVFESEMLRRDGSPLPVEISARRFLVGRRVFLQEIVRDVTERKRAEAALRESEASLAATLQSIGDAVIATDAEARVVRMNAAAETLTGWTLVEARGRPLAEVYRVVDESTGEAVRTTVECVFREGGKTIGGGRTALVDRNGRRWSLAESAAPIRDGTGRIAGVVLVFRDVGAERARERELVYQADLVGAMSDAVIAFGPDFTLRSWNPAAEAIYGWKAEEVLGRRIGELLAGVPGGGGQAVVRESWNFGRIALERGRNRGELRHLWRDGTPIDVEVTGVALHDEAGRPAGALAVVRDVTERTRLQARLVLADRMASVGTLAAGVAHEINNPLAYVASNLAFALEELGPLASRSDPDAAVIAAAVEALAEAREGADRVRRIVRDLKTFSRADEGERRGPVDPVRVVEASIAMAQNAIKHRARLEKRLAPVPPVQGDQSRLGQVFLNLLVNAVQAIPEGHADEHRIAVESGVAADRVFVQVSDTGSGIPPELLGRIFDPFFTTKAVGEGTGLGLAICHGIVTGLGGEITVESEPGRGTTFRVLLPPVPPEGELEAPAEPPPPASRPARVLVVDDEPLVGRALERQLGECHAVVAVTEARSALRRVTDGERFDAILCDVMMPEVGGIEFLAELRRIAPELAPRVVFMTGGAFTARAREFLESCGNRTLEKPFAPGAVERVLAEVLDEAG